MCLESDWTAGHEIATGTQYPIMHAHAIDCTADCVWKKDNTDTD